MTTDSSIPPSRSAINGISPLPTEQWGSRFGLVMAMAGNAIGLGNFLRFPRLAAEHGGGAFLIPYFIALLLLGIPLMWVEWTMGRHGGQFGHHSTPGMFLRMTGSRWGKLIGSLGISLPILFVVFYTYIESWTLAYAFYSITGAYTTEAVNLATSEPMMHTRQFLHDYQGVTPEGERVYFQSLWPAITFWLIAVGLNCWIISRGVSAGIEKLAKIAMPLLFLFAIVLAIRVLCTGAPDASLPDRSPWVGLNFVWEPNFMALAHFDVWLAAAGQIFFTLSIGTGSIQCYASYLKRDDDCAMTGFATAATNEFAEVVLGGTIAIPLAVSSFGLAATQIIASQGSFDLGFVAMPLAFEDLPLGWLFATLWFSLLFFAGITSSVGLCMPLAAFLHEAYGIGQKGSAAICGAFMLVLGLPLVLFLGHGYLDQYDFWVGTFGLALFAFLELICFGWIFGRHAMWTELQRGADLKIPRIFYYIIRYIAPAYLLVLLVGWTWESVGKEILLEGAPVKDHPYLWLSRGTIAGVVALLGLLVFLWSSNHSIESEEARGDV
ncbi:MAG: sodium-dependent transporter [Planctomycetales bacterium]|nr:sodium-dependent transporter [Planctomycetales bacterium]